MYRSELLYNWVKQNPIDNVWPVFVPSYNRPNAKLLKRLDLEPEFPIVLCIRREQYDMYKQYQDKCGIMLLDRVNDISETRQQIISEAMKYYDNIFMMDDDITWLDFMIPSQTSSGKLSMRPSKTCYGPYPKGTHILSMWQSLLNEDPCRDKIAISSIGYKPDNWAISNADKQNSYNSGACIQCIHLNLRLLKTHNISYKPMTMVGNEDYGLQFDIMSAGLLSTVYKDLMYDCPAINSVPGGCEDMLGLNHEDRYKMYVSCAKNYYGSHPGVKFTKTKRTGIESMKFNWNYWRKWNEHCN